MTVRQLLAQKGTRVETVRPDQTVYEALEKMAGSNIGALVVTAEGSIVGILSERDYARKVILLGKASRDTPVREIMSSPVITIAPAASMEDCMQVMTDRRLRHLPVVEDEQMVGIISIGDVVKTVISEQEFMIEQLQNYIDLR
jgi:CBS domain-containing protein